MNEPIKRFYRFGPFSIDVEKRVLLREGSAVPLAPKTFDTLLVLVEHHGQVLEKEGLMEMLWPDSEVEEANLPMNISALRKALGESPSDRRYIITIPGRGYRFAADVMEASDDTPEVIVARYTKSTLVIQDQEQSQALEQKPKSMMAAFVSSASRRKLVFIGLAAIFALGAISFYFLYGKGQPTSKEIDSIAILPFANSSGDPNAEYLSDGITEGLINSLSQLSQLKVIARTTVFRYKGKETDAQAIGRDLRVDAIVTGTVTQQGDTLVVQADLLSVTDGSQVWGARYSRKPSDIFAVQGQIAKEIADNLQFKLTGEERQVLAKRYTDNPESYKEYLQGRLFWNKRTVDGMKKGIEHFEQAIAHDPNYALAYAGLADCYAMLYQYDSPSSKEDILRAKAAATKALQIDSTLGEAHASLAFVLSNERDYSGADREYKQAIELNPNYATAYHRYAGILHSSGRPDEALQMIKRAQELDPLSLIINTALGRHYYLNRRYDEAIEQLRKTLEMDPTFIHAYGFIAMAYLKKGMYEDAVKVTEKAKVLSDNFSMQTWEIVSYRGYVYALSGKRAEAQKILKDLIDLRKRRHILAFHIALIYVGLSETDQFFAWLETAYNEQELFFSSLSDPNLDSLRSDPRFADILRRMGVPQ
jgi:TolB-like protein/DNA-binding winged helix-turn-helix (wHTH) protein/Tfp pilus assembly protein PilF